MAKKNHAAEGTEGAEGEVAAVEKKPAFCDVQVNQDGHVTFAFGNGESISLSPAELPEEQQENLLRHGLVQKVRDSFASAKGDFAFAKGAAEKVINQLRNNQWTASRGSGDSKPKTGELVAAL